MFADAVRTNLYGVSVKRTSQIGRRRAKEKLNGCDSTQETVGTKEVLALLKLNRGAMSPSDVARANEISGKSALSILRELEKNGDVVSGKGSFGELMYQAS